MWNRFKRWFLSLFRKPTPSLPTNEEEDTQDTTPIRNPVSSIFTPSGYVDMYVELWDTMEIKRSKKSTISWYVNQLLKHRERYETVANKTEVPWQVIGVIHQLESSGDFSGVLHNGDKIIGTGRKTYRVPKGRGPFDSWEEAAMDALFIKKRPEDWSIVNTLYFLERYNGLGYLNDPKKPNSPYLWSFSNHYVKGKYVSDGRYSSSAVSKQCGAAVILKEIGYAG